MARLDDHSLRLGTQDYVPLVLGGMGVDISTSELALEIARLGGIGHISDALAATVTDRRHGTRHQQAKARLNLVSVGKLDKQAVHFDLTALRETTLLHVGGTMAAKRGPGAIFVNVMEKLTMNAPKETLRVRLCAALDAGADGITLSAGLHLGSLELMADHPRFREAQIGILVSSVRALRPFLMRARRLGRWPDYVVVEGPLAGGHLGFGIEEWRTADLKAIVKEVLGLLESEGLSIPVIPAGGIFTGADAFEYLRMGAGAVQVATRFTIASECGLPQDVKQRYLEAEEEDVEVNMISPTGYPMRMLRSSPAIGSNMRPNCEMLGYVLDSQGRCSYLDAYARAGVDEAGRRRGVFDKTCLCTHMRGFRIYTCGQTVHRLKETTVRGEDGRFVLPSAAEVFNDYLTVER